MINIFTLKQASDNYGKKLNVASFIETNIKLKFDLYYLLDQKEFDFI